MSSRGEPMGGLERQRLQEAIAQAGPWNDVVGLFENAPEALRADRQVALAAVAKRGEALQCASEGLRADPEFMRAVRQRLLEAIAQADSFDAWRLFENAPAALRADRQVALAAVVKHGDALEYASAALRDDPEFMRSVRQRLLEDIAQADSFDAWRLFRDAPAALRADRQVALAAVAENGDALQLASEELRDDRQVALVAVAKYGPALDFASEALRDDRQVVLAAVTNDGHALKHASAALRDDRQVVLAAVAENGFALRHASEALREDTRFVLEAVAANIGALQGASGISQLYEHELKEPACELLLASASAAAAGDCGGLLPLLCDPDARLQTAGAQMAAQACAAVESAAEPTGVRYRIISAGVIRTRKAMDSDKAKREKTVEGEVILVTETGELEDGTARLKFDGGWTSLTAKSGKVLIEKLEDQEPSAEEDPATDASVASAAAAALVLRILLELLSGGAGAAQQQAARALAHAMRDPEAERQIKTEITKSADAKDLLAVLADSSNAELAAQAERLLESAEPGLNKKKTAERRKELRQGGLAVLFGRQKQLGWMEPNPAAEYGADLVWGTRIFVEGHGPGEVQRFNPSKLNSRLDTHEVIFDDDSENDKNPAYGDKYKEVKLRRKGNGQTRWLLAPERESDEVVWKTRNLYV